MSNFSLKFIFKQYKLLFFVVIFFLAIGVWYSPIIFKGYSTQGIPSAIVLARNYYQSGVLAEQNDLNVTLAPSLIKEEGHPLVLSEYLHSFFYAKIFKITGIPDYNNLILISIILYALALILFTVLTLYLFDLKTAIVFSLIYIFSPLGWGLTNSLGSYEFCLIFWALFFIFYFLGVKRIEQSRGWFNNLFFIISGIFLALSALSKEAVLVFALAFFVFLLIKKIKQQLIYIFIPFVLLLMVFWLPSILSRQNLYLSMLTGKAIEEANFTIYMHVFPDPYTYYFEREEFLEKFRDQNLDWTENLQTKKDLIRFGFEKINLFERVKVGFYILPQHISRFFSLEDFGGPFILLLLLLGLIYLRNKYKFLYNLFLCWLVVSLFVFIFVILVSRNHLMDFIWPLMLLITLGLFYLIIVIRNHFKFEKRKSIIIGMILIILLLYHLILINHVVLGRQYDKESVPRSITYAQEIKKLNIKDVKVITIPGDFPDQATTLNYLTNKSFVIFQSSTLKKLLKEDKLKQAFEAFGVGYILGYSDELSNEIIISTGVVNIASNSLKIDIGEVSANKSFFMNLVR